MFYIFAALSPKETRQGQRNQNKIIFSFVC